MIQVVTYVYDPGAESVITELRPAHREFLSALHAEGILKVSGPWVGGPAGAYLLLATESQAQALEALEDDPFHRAGVIAERSVQGWAPVIGEIS